MRIELNWVGDFVPFVKRECKHNVFLYWRWESESSFFTSFHSFWPCIPKCILVRGHLTKVQSLKKLSKTHSSESSRAILFLFSAVIPIVVSWYNFNLFTWILVLVLFWCAKPCLHLSHRVDVPKCATPISMSSLVTYTISTSTYEFVDTLFDCAHCGGGVRTVALALWRGGPQTRDLKRATTWSHAWSWKRA